jgi:ABC-type molybdate transport system substrate-binding protein
VRQPFPSLIVVAVLCWASLGTPALSQGVLGAGSTFVYPVLAKWAEAYEAVTGVKIDYQAVGSGVGIRQIKSRTVSELPMRHCVRKNWPPRASCSFQLSSEAWCQW